MDAGSIPNGKIGCKYLHSPCNLFHSQAGMMLKSNARVGIFFAQALASLGYTAGASPSFSATDFACVNSKR